MNKSEIDEQASQLANAIRPFADRYSLVQEGITQLELELNNIIQHAPDPESARLAGKEAVTRAEEDVVRNIRRIAQQIDYTVNHIDNGDYPEDQERLQNLRGLLEEKRKYFSQFCNEDDDSSLY